MAVPYVLQFKEEVDKVHIRNLNNGINDNSTHITYLPNITSVPIVAPVVSEDQNILNIHVQNNVDSHNNIVYQVVYPNQLSAQPIEKIKRGRKKKKLEEPPEQKQEPDVKILKPAPRTRSGRVVKFPKHMEKDFKKVEIKDTNKSTQNLVADAEIETSDFMQFKEEPPPKPSNMQQLDFHQRRRKIASQYRCPKCLKAYLGKMKMIQHIKKYPDHGPLPQKENSKVNFQVWNFLVDITQKCSVAQRGIKFCEELTNLLHNVMLLTSALFKKVDENKNFVEVDKVLGNAIGLSPGYYMFNDAELYKDVTVLKLITNTDFFKPVDPVDQQNNPKSQENVSNTKTIKEEVTEDRNLTKVTVNKESKDLDPVYFEEQDLEKSAYSIYETEPKIYPDLENVKEEPKKVVPDIAKNGKKGDKVIDIVNNVTKNLEDVYFNTPEALRKSPAYDIPQPDSKLGAHLEDNDETTDTDPELLSDHSLLHLSNIRNTVDELMLTSVDPVGTLLDNSTSSDEVMNVDQFVNERFKKITEPDLELGAASLNLDLPSLDLFQFHTT